MTRRRVSVILAGSCNQFPLPDLLGFYRTSPSNATTSIHFYSPPDHFYNAALTYLVSGVNQANTSLKELKSGTPGRVPRKIPLIDYAVTTTISEFFNKLPQNLSRQCCRQSATQNQLTDHCSKLTIYSVEGNDFS